MRHITSTMTKIILKRKRGARSWVLIFKYIETLDYEWCETRARLKITQREKKRHASSLPGAFRSLCYP